MFLFLFTKIQYKKGCLIPEFVFFFCQNTHFYSKINKIQFKMQFTLATIAIVSAVAASSSNVQIRGSAHAIDRGFLTPLSVRNPFNGTSVTLAVMGSLTPNNFFVGSDGLIVDSRSGYLDVVSSGEHAGLLYFNQTQSETDIQIRQPGPMPGNYWECPGVFPLASYQNAIVSADASPSASGCYPIDLTVSATWSTSSSSTPPPISSTTDNGNSTTLITTTLPVITSYTTYCPLPTVITVTSCSQDKCVPVPVTVTTASTVTCQSCVAPVSPTTAPTAPIVNGAHALGRGIVGAAGVAAMLVMLL